MSKIITYNNILNPLDRTIYTSGAYKNSDEILKDLKYDNTIYELIISKNSVIQNGYFEVSDGDIVNITIMPKGGGGGGKNIIGMVAMIALAVVSAGVGAAYGASLGASLFGTASYATAMGTALIAGGIMMAGSLLINAVMPKPNMDLGFGSNDFKHSQTYSWNRASNTAYQGGVIPKIYGIHKITPPLIASYIEANGDKQYFNALYAVNNGLIKEIKNIQINNEPIQNYKGVSYEIRNGDINQSIIPNFNDTYYDKPVNKKLNPDASFSISSTDGNAVRKLVVTLLMPRGLWYANDSGTMDANSIDVLIEYSSDDSYYKQLARDTISSNQTSAFRKTYQIDNLAPSKYFVRVKFASSVNTGSRYSSDCVFELLSEVTKDDFIYPGTALLAIRALATDQLNGSAPIVSCEVSANSDNPALICQSILADCGVSSDRLSPNFKIWADYCEAKELRCNIVFDTELSVKKALDTVSLLGRASIIQAGSKYDVIIDKPGLIPVQSFMFGMGNILKDSFTQNFLPLIDRANFIEITYYDKQKDYEPTITSVLADGYDLSKISNKTSLTLVGCTDEVQARSYGRFMLNCNRYLTQTIEFEADKDSLVCRYGDIIRVSHDTPAYGFSGRLANDSQNNILTLDRDIEFNLDSRYAVQIKNDINEVKEYEIAAFINPHTIELDLGSDSYKAFDIYAVGKINKVTKLYRIIKISTGGEFTRKITAIEYNEDVYNDSEEIKSSQISQLNIGCIRVNENLKLDGNKLKTYINLAWRGFDFSYKVSYKNLRTNKIRHLKVFDSFASFEVLDGDLYEISVSDNLGNFEKMTYSVLGKSEPPSAVSNLRAFEFDDEWELTWDYLPPIDFSHYEVYSQAKLELNTKDKKANIKKSLNSIDVRVYAVDTSNIKSEARLIRVNATPPDNVSGFSTIYKDNKLNAYWSSVGEGFCYELRKGTSWSSAYLVADTKELIVGLNFNGTYLIKAYQLNKYGLKIYSQTPAVLVVDEAKLDVNVMEQIIAPSWSGSHNNTMINNNGLSLSYNKNTSNKRLNSLNGTYELSKIVRLSREKICNINAFMDISGLAINSNFDSFSNVDLVKNIDGANENDYSAKLQISTSKDGYNFGEYRNFTNGQYIAMAFKFRLVFESKTYIITPFISALNILVDMPDIIESQSSQSSTTGSINIRYKNDFSTTPKVQITIINASSGDDAIVTNQSSSGFSIKIVDANGRNVSREFNYIAKGY